MRKATKADKMMSDWKHQIRKILASARAKDIGWTMDKLQLMVGAVTYYDRRAVLKYVESIAWVNTRTREWFLVWNQVGTTLYGRKVQKK